MVNPIYGSLGLLLSGNWAECQAGVDSILRGSFPAFTRGNFVSSDRKVLLPTEGMAGSEPHRSKKGRGRGSSRSKPKHKQDETVPIFNHYGSSSESDDWDSEKEIGNGEFNGEYVETYSTFQAGQEHDEFVAAQQQMECRHDLICNLKSSEAETPACNAVELELTLGSQSSCSPPTPRKVSALDISWNEARWDHCMLETYLP